MRSYRVRGEEVGIEESWFGRRGGVVDDGAANDSSGDENRYSL